MWMSLIQAGIPLGIMLGYLMTGYLAESGKANPPECFLTVPTELEDCCEQSPFGVDVNCASKTFEDISSCCDLNSAELVCSSSDTLTDHTYDLSSCCKTFDCPGGCWQCKWKLAVFVQVRN